MIARGNASAGFTLIEVLLVSVLLFFLSLGLFRSVKDTVTAKSSIDEGTETLQMARAAMAMLERDVRSAYFVTAEDLGWDPPAANPADPNAAPTAIKPNPVTIFQGKANELFMSSRSHQRMAVDAPENEQHFVTYQLRGEDLIRAESHRAVSLSDRESPDQFREFTLLQKVKSFKVSYWSIRSENWQDRWDTDGEENRNELPTAVKVQLEFLPDAKGHGSKGPKPFVIETAIRPLESAMRPGMGARQTPGMNADDIKDAFNKPLQTPSGGP